MTKFVVTPEASGKQYPAQWTLRKERTGVEETVRAKFLVSEWRGGKHDPQPAGRSVRSREHGDILGDSGLYF